MIKFFIVLVLLGVPTFVLSSSARAQAFDSHTEPEAGSIGRSGSYGVRLGAAYRFGLEGTKPLFNPYYNASIGRQFDMCAELMLSFENFQTLDFFTFNEFRLDSYGFNLKFKRWFGSESETAFFMAAGPELSVLRERVSVGLSLSSGVVYPLSTMTGLEFSGFVTPLAYFGQGPGLFAGLTIGVRFRDN